MPGSSFRTNHYHWHVADPDRFWAGLNQVFGSLRGDEGSFSADGLVAWGRNLGFLDDEAFTRAWDAHATATHERGIIWRTAILVWAARQALRRDGDFVECGCYAGTSMRIVMDAVGLKNRRVYLYDIFEHEPGMAHHAMPEHGPDLYTQVRARFANDAHVSVIRGLVPESFAQGVPEKVAFAHIDMNNAPAETAALNALEPRFAPGAVIVLDDYGQLYYAAQHLAHRDWFAQRGVPVMELPTGQGVVIW